MRHKSGGARWVRIENAGIQAADAKDVALENGAEETCGCLNA